MPHVAPADPAFDLPISGCLDFLLPALPETLVGPSARRWIEGAAEEAPPTGGLGLELRLDAGDRGADLHQVFHARGADPSILSRHLAQPGGNGMADGLVRPFLERWSADRPSVRDALHTLYFEWDRPAEGAPLAPPGIFIPVEPAGARDSERQRRRHAAIRCSHDIDPGLGGCVGAALDTLSRSLPRGASLNYTGFMLGRSGAVRVNVRGVRPADLGPWLDRLGWRGDIATATGHFERLVALSDRVIIGLDFSPDLQPKIGLEAVLDLPPPKEHRWPRLFDYFVAEAGCAEDKRRALEAFPASFYPETKGQPWPASWLVAAVRSPKAFAPWVERRVSHLKLIVAADGAVSAKAYITVQHHWRRSGQQAPAPNALIGRPTDAALVEAIGEAVGFIVGAIGQDDLWRDFSMPGASDEWATAFVGWALTAVDDPRAREAAKRGIEGLMRRQRANGGWAYNANCAGDADSTAWALKCLAGSGVSGPAVDKARAFLDTHRLPDGGFSTYTADAQLIFDDKVWHGPSEGWRAHHLCVAANAAGALPDRLADTLRDGQKADGSWPAYWWRTDIFATAMAVEALAEQGECEDVVRRALEWARQQSSLTHTGFDRAWLAQILRHGDDGDIAIAERILGALAREQNADGSWPSGAQLLLPHPSALELGDGLKPYLDVRRLFTTAAVMRAMTDFRARTAQ